MKLSFFFILYIFLSFMASALLSILHLFLFYHMGFLIKVSYKKVEGRQTGDEDVGVGLVPQTKGRGKGRLGAPTIENPVVGTLVY